VLFGGRSDLTFVIENRAGTPTVEQAEALLKSLVRWQEENNLHQGKVYLSHSMKAEIGDAKAWDAKRWRAFWGLKQAGVVGQPRFAGEVTFERLLNDPGSLTPADFRLTKDSPGKGKGEGGKDLGADVDLVGPGEPYEKWKKTPEYAAWQKKTRELLDGKKQ